MATTDPKEKEELEDDVILKTSPISKRKVTLKIISRRCGRIKE